MWVIMIMKVYARAKINLTLDVLGRRPDGYHQVETVMQSIALHDCLEFVSQATGLVLTVSDRTLSSGADNLVYRAALLLQKRTNTKRGVLIRLNKQIPVAAGLGGGSADAAATLKALNTLWELHLSEEELLALGAELGSDIPFCLKGGTALASGRGEQLTPLAPAPRLGLVLVKPSFPVSTAAVYQAYDALPAGENPSTIAMAQAIREQSLAGVVQNLANMLESATISMHPEIAEIKERLLVAGALGVLMAGSGPTVFAVTAGVQEAQVLASRFVHRGELVLVSETWWP